MMERRRQARADPAGARPVSKRVFRLDPAPDLLSALAAQTLTELAARIRGDAASQGRRSPLHRGCAAYLRHAVELPHHYLLIFGDTPIAQPGQELESAADDAMLALLELVERAQADGELGGGPPRELATIVWVLLHGLARLQITGHLHEPRTIDGNTKVDDLLALALAALRPTANAE
jgi:hypothetical protein